MLPEQMQNFFLVVGAERRKNPGQGSESKILQRKVMGRKGVGKLAPFGICNTIEVISSGGKEVKRRENGTEIKGYLTSHIILSHEDAVSDAIDGPYYPKIGSLDMKLRDHRGTTIILRDFNHRRVPKIETLSRQTAQRFGIKSQDWEIILKDNNPEPGAKQACQTVGDFDISLMDNTKISFNPDAGPDFRVIGPNGESINDLKPGFEHDEEFYKVRGWVAYAKSPYKDDLMAGVRIYCRGKIASQTSTFNKTAGFTGEHNVRSYMVGELHADWLDEKQDLIQTDRRDIMWSEELCAAFEQWGQKIVSRVGKLSRDPLRKTTKELFFETGRVEERVRENYPSENDQMIQRQALDIAEMLGKTISRAEAEDEEVVNDLVDLSIMIAPTITLDDAMREASKENRTTLSAVISLLRTARIAELSSFGKVAEQRIKVIESLERLKNDDSTTEPQLQELIEGAPWLINPEWAPVTANQTLNTLRKEFEKYHKETTGKSISLSNFDDTRKKPDFVLLTYGNTVQIVEIKRPGHALTSEEMDRIINYRRSMENFLRDSKNEPFVQFFNAFHITLVCDEINLPSPSAQEEAYEGYLSREILTHINWSSFLLRVKQAHNDFLEVAEKTLQTIVSKEEM